MFTIPTNEFEELVHDAVDNLPKIHKDRLQNVAFFVRDIPSPDQRQKAQLNPNQSLFGLYEGVPLSQRNGNLKLLPDIITIFQLPIEASTNSLNELKEQITHTVWHEVAHFFGLGHKKIYEIEAMFKAKQ